MFKKKKFGEKGCFRPQPRLNSNGFYLSLVPPDALYTHNLPHLTTPQLKLSLLKLARDLNLLLFMDSEQFWRELDENDSLPLCLESCLSVFARREYGRYEDGRGVNRETMGGEVPQFGLYSALMETVLRVYYRMSEAPSRFAVETLYHRWLLDVPKLLDLAAVYGASSPQLVRKLISNVYAAVQDFDEDTLAFFSLLDQHPFLQFGNERSDIDFRSSSLRRKNYSNREKFMLRETAKELFKVKDMLFSLSNFLTYFPKKYAYEFAVDYKIQEKLIKALVDFLKQTQEDWKLEHHA
jgi:hypothetical protein